MEVGLGAEEACHFRNDGDNVVNVFQINLMNLYEIQM